MQTPAITLLEELCVSEPSASHSLVETVPTTLVAFAPGANPDLIAIECWVARAVYGVDNPRWLQFREWLMSDAPAWFRRLYIRHGERFARWITPHQRVKSVIRRWMDFIIARR